MSKHFSDKELNCQCGCGFAPLSELVDRLDQLRDAWGSPITLNSCARCPDHNTKVGGEPHSQHLLGKAADVSTTDFKGQDYSAFIRLAKHMGFNGIGQGSTFLHIDIRSVPGTWKYGSDGKPIKA